VKGSHIAASYSGGLVVVVKQLRNHDAVDCYSDSFSLANRIFLSVSICCMISSPAVMLLNMIGASDG
jgi:hypothetical protein